MQKQTDRTSLVVREPFNRPPRILISPPQGDIEIPEPPEREILPPLTGVSQLVISLLMITSLLFVYTAISHASTQQIAMILPIAMISVLSPLGSIFSGLQKRKTIRHENRVNLKAYKKLLVQLREQM